MIVCSYFLVEEVWLLHCHNMKMRINQFIQRIVLILQETITTTKNYQAKGSTYEFIINNKGSMIINY